MTLGVILLLGDFMYLEIISNERLLFTPFLFPVYVIGSCFGPVIR